MLLRLTVYTKVHPADFLFVWICVCSCISGWRLENTRRWCLVGVFGFHYFMPCLASLMQLLYPTPLSSINRSIDRFAHWDERSRMRANDDWWESSFSLISWRGDHTSHCWRDFCIRHPRRFALRDEHSRIHVNADWWGVYFPSFKCRSDHTF